MTHPAHPPEPPPPSVPPAPETPAAAVPPAVSAHAEEPPRPLIRRLFGISIWGGVKLLLLCILVGFFVMAANYDTGDPDFNIGQALGAILSQSANALGWALRNFWQPALAGALVVLPVWVLWRLVSFPFRK